MKPWNINQKTLLVGKIQKINQLISLKTRNDLLHDRRVIRLESEFNYKTMIWTIRNNWANSELVLDFSHDYGDTTKKLKMVADFISVKSYNLNLKSDIKKAINDQLEINRRV